MNITKQNIYTTLSVLPYFFSVTGMLVLDNGDKKLVPFILISIAVSIALHKKETIVNNLRYPFVWLVTLLCLYTTFSYYYHGANSGEIRALIGATLFLITFPYRLLTRKTIHWILFIGSVFVCINSLYFNVYLGISRDAGYINPIPYATTTALLAIISFSSSIDGESFKKKSLPLIAFLLYLPPIVLSESRGIWLAFTISLIILVVIKCLTTSPTKRQLFHSLIITILLTFLASYIFKNQISERYSNTVQEIHQIKNDDFNTSFGLRLQMWELAPELFKQKPIIGYGNNHEIILRKKLDEKLISNSLYHYASSHYHNQFLDKMVKSGTIGLLFIIGLLVYPLIKIKSLNENNRYMVIGSTSLFFIAGLTDVPFNHPQPLLMYLLFLVPICSRHKRVFND
ncbi:O-antigen ligase family protein [Vibrio splendidus]